MRTKRTAEPEHSFPVALQSLFYKVSSKGLQYLNENVTWQLQYQNSSVSTEDLTKSFGWSISDVLQQRDILEVEEIIFQELEEKSMVCSSVLPAFML